MRAQETIGQGFVFAQKPQQQVLRFNVGRAELAGLITRKEDDAPGFLRITFKHIALPLSSRGEVGQRARPPFHGNPSSPIPLCNQGTNRPTIKSWQQPGSVTYGTPILSATCFLYATICNTARGCNSSSNLTDSCRPVWLSTLTRTRLCEKRLRRYLLGATLMQPQHAVAAAGKRKIVGGNERGKLIVAM